MGLDMYVCTRKNGEERELKYWRKNHDLHGWMQHLYAKKTGEDDSENFNGVEVELTLEDLNDLSNDIRSSSLPHTSGFFFGNNPPDADSNAEDLAFVEDAKRHVKDGYSIFYNSSW